MIDLLILTNIYGEKEYSKISIKEGLERFLIRNQFSYHFDVPLARNVGGLSGLVGIQSWKQSTSLS